LAQARARIYELPISYDGRSYAEGKKTNWKDGVAALYYILRSNILGPKSAPWQAPKVQPWEGRALTHVKRSALTAGTAENAPSDVLEEDEGHGGGGSSR
jgi:hypothetical protein